MAIMPINNIAENNVVLDCGVQRCQNTEVAFNYAELVLVNDDLDLVGFGFKHVLD